MKLYRVVFDGQPVYVASESMFGAIIEWRRAEVQNDPDTPSGEIEGWEPEGVALVAEGAEVFVQPAGFTKEESYAYKTNICWIGDERVTCGLNEDGRPCIYLLGDGGTLRKYSKGDHMSALDTLGAGPGEILYLSIYRS